MGLLVGRGNSTTMTSQLRGPPLVINNLMASGKHYPFMTSMVWQVLPASESIGDITWHLSTDLPDMIILSPIDFTVCNESYNYLLLDCCVCLLILDTCQPC